MIDLLLWLICIPVIIFAAKFWFGVARWLIRNQQTLGGRVQQVRNAFVEGVHQDK